MSEKLIYAPSPELMKAIVMIVRNEMRRIGQPPVNGMSGPLPPGTSEYINITSQKTPSGRYGCKIGVLKPTWFDNLASGAVTSPDDLFDWPASENGLFVNQPEVFSTPVTHWVPNNAKIWARVGVWPNSLNLTAFVDNYAKALRDIDFDEVTGCLRKTFVQNPSTGDWEEVTCAVDCPPGSSAPEIAMF